MIKSQVGLLIRKTAKARQYTDIKSKMRSHLLTLLTLVRYHLPPPSNFSLLPLYRRDDTTRWERVSVRRSVCDALAFRRSRSDICRVNGPVIPPKVNKRNADRLTDKRTYKRTNKCLHLSSTRRCSQLWPFGQHKKNQTVEADLSFVHLKTGAPPKLSDTWFT